MPLRCNIDAKGKLLRLVAGTATLLVGIIVFFGWTLPAGTMPSWIVSCVILVSGAFVLFEARAGWCALRALGFKTKF